MMIFAMSKKEYICLTFQTKLKWHYGYQLQDM